MALGSLVGDAACASAGASTAPVGMIGSMLILGFGNRMAYHIQGWCEGPLKLIERQISGYFQRSEVKTVVVRSQVRK